MNDNPAAVVLLSGGLDSAVTAAVAIERGFEVHALSFSYGQRHAVEEQAARRVAQSLGIGHHVFQRIDLRAFGGSALTDKIPVPKRGAEKPGASGIPITYVPARNTIFLAFALGFAEVLGAEDIFLGVNAVDYSGYPDCRGEYLRKFEELAALATRAGVEGRPARIHAPLLHWSKGQIVQEGARLGVEFALTHSCYDPDHQGRACGACDSCVLRLEGFRQAGRTDPAAYVPAEGRGQGPCAIV